ncbi:MAG: Fe-Mn family superoxide dismutase [bacterium]|nr:Fe-Mn family superoxide dismutase [bacterium]
MINAIEFNHTPDITVINVRQFEAHYSLYVGYINSINKITNQLQTLCEEDIKEANTTNGFYRGLKRGETYALDGVILHELYFRNIGGCNKEPKDYVKCAIEKYFGSFDKWREDFIATGKASRGWAILFWDQRTKRLRNISLDAHDVGPIVLGLPLLVMDMYEHAYFLQYAQNKTAYIEAFMENIHWDIVAQRMKFWNL